jgi:hypothetical protein
MDSALDRGFCITSKAENELLRYEEGYALSLEQESINLAWAMWFQSLSPKTSKKKTGGR